MPGFNISGIGNIPTGIGQNLSFYTSYSWDIRSLSNILPTSSTNAIVLLRSATLPQVTFKKEKVEGGTVEYKFAGKPSYEDVRISWYDSHGMIDIIKQWKSRVYTKERGVRPPSMYKAETSICKYLASTVPDGSYGRDTDVTYTLFGSWPIAYKESELAYLESNIKHVEVTLSYDEYDIS